MSSPCSRPAPSLPPLLRESAHALSHRRAPYGPAAASPQCCRLPMRALSPLPCVSSVPWFSATPTAVFLQSSVVRVQSLYSLPQCRRVHSRPLPVPWPSRALVRPVCEHTALPCDRIRPGYPPRISRVVPPSEVPLYNP